MFVDLRCPECAHCVNCTSYDDSLACACETGYTGIRCHLGNLKDDVMFSFITLSPGELHLGLFVCLSGRVTDQLCSELLIFLSGPNNLFKDSSPLGNAP